MYCQAALLKLIALFATASVATAGVNLLDPRVYEVCQFGLGMSHPAEEFAIGGL